LQRDKQSKGSPLKQSKSKGSALIIENKGLRDKDLRVTGRCLRVVILGTALKYSLTVMVIVVPAGDVSDPTRESAFYDPTYRYLSGLGVPVLD